MLERAPDGQMIDVADDFDDGRLTVVEVPIFPGRHSARR
jgi:hypothetical protein